MDVSVIIPVYNAAVTLKYCVESCLSQTGIDLEIILVNDGSQDSSLDIMRVYERQDSRIRVIDIPNGGVVNARMTGVSAAAGEFICFVDADDALAPRALSILHSESPDADIVSGKSLSVPLEEISDFKHALELKPFARTVYSQESFLRHIIRDNIYSLYARLFRKKLFDGIVLDNRIKWGEDFTMMVQLSGQVSSVVELDATVYYYCLNPQSVTRSCTLNVFLTWRLAWELVDNYLVKSGMIKVLKADWAFRTLTMELGGLRIGRARFGYCKTIFRPIAWKLLVKHPSLWFDVVHNAPKFIRLQLLIAMVSPVLAVSCGDFYGRLKAVK